jgi:hypothetical protein
LWDFKTCGDGEKKNPDVLKKNIEYGGLAEWSKAIDSNRACKFPFWEVWSIANKPSISLDYEAFAFSKLSKACEGKP